MTVGFVWLVCQIPLAVYFGWTNDDLVVAASKLVCVSVVGGLLIVFGPSIALWFVKAGML